ncbi:DUF6879 family protein [Nocardiopsis exhalans]|uniref:DUF6879 family protein n=1 Tax=Nocardiopsis exhalans TaxID=163604 RepID=UPI0031DDE62D
MPLVVVRAQNRARVLGVSEPLSDYIRWERAATRFNDEAGEDIRWLPATTRRSSSTSGPSTCARRAPATGRRPVPWSCARSIPWAENRQAY